MSLTCPSMSCMRPALVRRRAQVLALVLSALLLLAQGLGLLHTFEHADTHAGQALAHVDEPAGEPTSAASAHEPGLHWFGEHQPGDAECRLLDQLAHADALPAAPLPLLAALPQAKAAGQAPAEAGRRHEARYLARAPPAA
jgi:hypothetical protein